MTVRFTKTFPTYADATRWLHEHGYSTAIVDISSTVTITLEGADAIRAIEEETRTKAIPSEAA
jgi:hypothetical protein